MAPKTVGFERSQRFLSIALLGFERQVSACWSACCLPQASLFFASPKKSKQKKGEPKAVALRATLRYSRRPGSGANSLRSNKRPPCSGRRCVAQHGLMASGAPRVATAGAAPAPAAATAVVTATACTTLAAALTRVRTAVAPRQAPSHSLRLHRSPIRANKPAPQPFAPTALPK